MSGTSPDHGDTHATHRHRVTIISGFVVIALIFFGILAWQGSTAVTVALPDGGSLKYLGTSQGERVAPKDVGEGNVVDMDGCQWNHFLRADSTWRQRAYETVPPLLRKHLPDTWAPPRPYYRMGTGNSQMMKWQVTGRFNAEDWWLTWVDENGFESTGHAAEFRFPDDTKPLAMTAAMPPCHSSKVILRLRKRVSEKPLSEWPLIAEMPMRNPSLVRKTAQAVDTLPVTRTQNGVSVTLKLIMVDPAAVGTNRAVEVRLRFSESEGRNALWPGVTFYDQRRMSMSMSLMSDYYERDKEDDIIRTSACLWSDAPWFVRVTLWPSQSSPNEALPPGLRHTLRFTGVPLPYDGPVINPGKYKGAAGGVDIALHTFQHNPDAGENNRWLLQIKRSKLPPQCIFHFVSVKDDLGRALPWGTETGSGGRDGALCGLSLIVPQDSQAKTADIEMAVERNLNFDFYVMPEFKGMGEKGTRP